MLLSQPCLLRDTASCLSLITALPKLLHDHSQALATNVAPAHGREVQQWWEQKPAVLLSVAVPLSAAGSPRTCAVPCFCWGCRQCPAAAACLWSWNSPSLSPLTWRQSKLQRCSELVLSSCRSQPVPRNTFLWLPEASQEEKPSRAPPAPPKLFIGKGQIIFSSVACSPVSHYLLWHGSGKTSTF